MNGKKLEPWVEVSRIVGDIAQISLAVFVALWAALVYESEMGWWLYGTCIGCFATMVFCAIGNLVFARSYRQMSADLKNAKRASTDWEEFELEPSGPHVLPTEQAEFDDERTVIMHEKYKYARVREGVGLEVSNDGENWSAPSKV